MKNLYFARLDYQGQCVAGGHFLALDAKSAKDEAAKAFEQTRATAAFHNLPSIPSILNCTLTVKRSNADQSNALND